MQITIAPRIASHQRQCYSGWGRDIERGVQEGGQRGQGQGATGKAAIGSCGVGVYELQAGQAFVGAVIMATLANGAALGSGS